MSDLKISEIKIDLMDKEQYRGLKGFVSFVINDMFLVSGVAIRKTKEGKLFLMYPARISSTNHRFFYVKPICRTAADAVDTAIISRLNELQEELIGGRTDERTNEVQVQ